MNILITGGTGFVGSALANDLKSSGHNVIVTTREQTDSGDKLTWNPPDLIPADKMSKIDAIVNLAGESIASGRWTKERKERILASRVNTTRALVQSIRNPSENGKDLKCPKVIISASAIGYYGPHGDEDITEDAPPASDFLANVCKKWEAEALKARESGVRVVIVRLGVVLGPDNGALSRISLPFKFFLGGPIGSGNQWFSWVHRDDVIGIIKFALDNNAISGPVNLTAPEPVTNKEFSNALGRALCRPSLLPVPGIVLKMALGELGEISLTGQKVIPEKALKAGYKFKYPTIDEALKSIYGKE